MDDTPVDMPTHAHGQGYSDPNFMIPELTANPHYEKGPYSADEGATAETVRIALKDEVVHPGVPRTFRARIQVQL